MPNLVSGFTLIELLVVVAIIGVLSTVVVVFLGSARNKNKDSSVKSQLNQARTQAELYYSTGSTYTGVCDIDSNNLIPKGINGMVFSAGKIYGYTTTQVNVNGADGSRPVACNVSFDGSGWAAQIPLSQKNDPLLYYYCVDYTRKGIVTTSSIVDYMGSPAAFCR